MNPVETIQELNRLGGNIRVENGKLKATAFIGVVTQGLLAAMSEHKAELILFFDLVKPGNCPACRKNRWWTRADGAKICGVCHPNPERLRAEHEQQTLGAQRGR